MKQTETPNSAAPVATYVNEWGEEVPERRTRPRDADDPRIAHLFNGFDCRIESAQVNFDSYAEGYLRAMRAEFAGLMTDMLAAPVAQPVSEPSNEQIEPFCMVQMNPQGDIVRAMRRPDRWMLSNKAAIKLYTHPAAPLTPRGFLLHWPKPGGGRELIWSETDAAGVMIGCPVEPVYSNGVRQEGGA